MSAIQSDIAGLPAHQVIVRPRITEKGTHLSGKLNCYVFEVSTSATKLDIKRAVEQSWGVRVLAVRVQNCIGKARRYRATVGVTAAKKKAIVKLHADDRLAFF